MLPRTLSDVEITKFQKMVWNYFHKHRREMPWRTSPTPYFVLVSELMLQQTQVSRVIPKFEMFVALYPDVTALAEASLAEVLVVWSGLGYNRRAKFLWQTARQTVDVHAGELPATLQDLVALPGIGPNTAGAILAYAYSQPAVFLETNIRTVLVHHFFADTSDKVPDRVLLSLVEQTLDREHPREWYWALMDYGTHLKKTAGGKLHRTAAYRPQSKLEGSLRQMRGKIIRTLTAGRLSGAELRQAVDADHRFEPALQALLDEGLIEVDQDNYSLTAASNTR